MRLDSFLFNKGCFQSRTKASEAIIKGEVLYNGKTVKPSLEVNSLEGITFVDGLKFVSNGGYKLHKALLDFNLSVSGLTFADIGASNGGFTDCLIKNGAKKIYAIDVGENQLDNSLLIDDKVVVIDNTNARYLTSSVIGEFVDGVTVDVSFISVTYVLDGINNVLKSNGFVVLLIKPQFECGKEYLGNSGIVKNRIARQNAVKKVYNACYEKGLYAINFTTAPIKEKKNVEYLMLLTKDDKKILKINEILSQI